MKKLILFVAALIVAFPSVCADGPKQKRKPSYENKSQVGKIALAISAFRTEVPDLCRSPIRSEGRQASLHSIIRLAGVPPCGRALMH